MVVDHARERPCTGRLEQKALELVRTALKGVHFGRITERSNVDVTSPAARTRDAFFEKPLEALYRVAHACAHGFKFRAGGAGREIGRL